MTHEYYNPSEGIYQHYAWAKNGKVLLCNDSDGEYEQVFGNREELHRFIEHLQEVADKAWPDPDLCVDIAETLERLQEINPEQYAWWYSKLYPAENPPGDEWTSYTLATLRNLVRWKGYCKASLDLSNQDDVVLKAVPYVELISDDELSDIYTKLAEGFWGENKQPGEEPRMYGFARTVLAAFKAR